VGEQYKSLSYSLCSFLHSPVTSSLLAPNILLSTVFSSSLIWRRVCWQIIQRSIPNRHGVTAQPRKISKFPGSFHIPSY
jgi:hypothetical protein